VLYNGIKPYPYTTDFFELFSNPTFARELLLKPFQLIDLTQLSDDDLKEQSLLGIMELLLKYAFARDTLLLIKKIGTLLQKADQMHEIELLRESAEYVFQTRSDDLSKNHILNEFKKHVSTPTQKNIMTIAEAFVEEGRQEGIQKGRQEGRNEERKKFRTLLHKQLERRFPGQVTSNHLGLLEEADGESLSLWLERLIDAHWIEEVFIW
jgi:predicted transposase YdaD